jgi:hypothetical protein
MRRPLRKRPNTLVCLRAIHRGASPSAQNTSRTICGFNRPGCPRCSVRTPDDCVAFDPCGRRGMCLEHGRPV